MTDISRFANKIRFILILVIGHHLEVNANSCPYIIESSRVPCGPTLESKCSEWGCCWDERAEVKCFQKECKLGTFGFGCRSNCTCARGSPCDLVTGECERGCPPDRWGVGCMLENDCSYNDIYDEHYMGGLSHTDSNLTCQPWSEQGAYDDDNFPDDKTLASNHCRNPDPPDYRTWCYYQLGPKMKDRKWGYCKLAKCECPVGRWGVNCEYECHCQDADEYCDQTNGECTSGCARGWTGRSCQECAAGVFGRMCEGTCHCEDPDDVCNKVDGRCRFGCAPGWEGPNCQQACKDRWFGVNCDLECNCEDEFEICNKETGACSSGCYHRYAGEGCLIAKPKPRIIRSTECHCRNPSDPCSPSNHCSSGCQGGWVGERCHLEVPSITRAPNEEARSVNSITVRWSRWRKPPDRGDGPVTGYFLYYRSEGESETQRVRTDHTRYTLEDLRNNTMYTIQIAPIHDQGFVGNSSPNVNISTCGVPTEGVRNLEVESEESKSSNRVSLRVTWEQVSQQDMDTFGCQRIIKYLVYTKGPDETDFVLYKECDVGRTTIPDVDPYSNFYVAVTMVNDAGFESTRAIQSIIAKSGPVQNARMTPNATSILIEWDPPLSANSAIENYIVRHRQLAIADCNSKISTWNPIFDLAPEETSFTLSELYAYSQYMVKVWVRTARHKKGQQVSKNVTTIAVVSSAKVQQLIQKELTATHVSLAWEPPPCELRNGRYVGYRVRLIHRNQDAGLVIDERIINATNLTITNKLTPYENYSVSIAYQNHVGAGPEETVNFRMLESTPPAPSHVQITTRSHDRLTLSWRPPSPPHGIIMRYELKHWTPANVGAPSHVILDDDVWEFTLENLKPSNSYTFQVRAATAVGGGAWSAVVHGFTEEAIPSRPVRLWNTSREETSLTLTWQEPELSNGVLTQYQVSCDVTRGRDRYRNFQPIKVQVSAATLYTTIIDLVPGSEYTCGVQARNGKGLSDPYESTFFTLPQKPEPPKAPNIMYKEMTDTTITLELMHTEFITPNVELTAISNRIVVERLTGYNAKSRSSRAVSRTEMPCSMRHAQMPDYAKAIEKDSHCYVTAELGRLDRQESFVVGDNMTYGGYYNAPLRKNMEYVLWQGIAVTVDGVTQASYARISTPLRATAYAHTAPPKSSAGVASIIAGVIVALMGVVLLLAIFIYFFLIRRKRHSSMNHYQHTGRYESEHLSSSPKASSHHEKSSTADVYIQSTDSEGEGDETDPLAPKPIAPRPVITVDSLWNYVRQGKSTNSQAFKQEYDEIPLGLTAHCEQARKPENRNKNRYGNIIAYDHSRVKLEPLPDDPHSDYINANYIDAYARRGAWIATQGPSKQTFNDLWRLVWQERAHRIIMVTNLIEDGRHKCEQYWPDTGSRTYGSISVEKLEEEQYADFTIRTFNMSQDEEGRIVRQFHFTAWPDHGCPIYATSLIAFRKKVRSYDDPTVGPTVVHCSAGVGRTGTFVALDYLLDMAKAEQQVDVYGCVQYMRTKRVNMVQTQEQYEFVYEALLEALKSGDTAIPCVDFRKRYCDLLKQNPDTGKVRLAEEFELLGMLSTTPPSQSGCKCALDTENANKNRHSSIIPLDNMQRPFLLTYIPGSSDYINAVFTDGYKHRDAFIITQMPLPHTVTDFWAMICDHECSAVVMMNEFDPSDSSCACYYPVQAGNQQHGPFTIETVVLDSTFPDITIRDVTLTTSKKASEPRSVRQFQFHGWPSDHKLPKRRNSVIQLLQLVEKWQQRSGNKTIVVHCMDGASRSGLLCAISYMIERLKVEQEVDVFNSVKHTRINRPQLVPSLEQYQYVYDMAEEYMDCFETYANFK